MKKIIFVCLFLLGAWHAAANEPNKVTLDEIVVTGDKVDAFSRQYPHQAVSVDAAEIKKRNFLDVYEALGTMPGVDVKPLSTGLGARISIRGSGGSGAVLILIDGRPINTSQYGGVDLSSLPMDMIKKITVFKPPVPVWLGPGSSAGAIYIETKKGRPGKSMEKDGRINVSGGSYGLANFSGSHKAGNKKSNTLFSAGFDRADGKRTNSEENNANLSVNWDHSTDNLTQYQINGKYFHSEHGVAGPTYNPTPNAEQRYDKGSLDVKMKGVWGDSADYDVKAYGDTAHLKDRSNSGDVYTMDLYEIGTGAEVVWSELKAKHDIRLGGFVEQVQVDHTQTGDHQRETSSIHIEHTYRMDHAALTTGARGDYTNDFDFNPAGNLGLMVDIASLAIIKASVGYSVNLPSFGQLYQPSHGSYDQVRGNPDLTEEQVVSYTFGIEHAFTKKNVLSVTLFRTDTHDLIRYQRGTDLINRPQNIDQAYKQGVEASFKYKANDLFALDINYIWQQTENEENHKELSYSPEHHGKLTLKSTLATKTRLELILRAYSDQFSDFDNTDAEKLDGYATTDVKVIQPVSLFSQSAEVFINFINLLDQDYESHYGYPDDGFRFIAGMNMNF